MRFAIISAVLVLAIIPRVAAQVALAVFTGVAHTQNSSLMLSQPALGTNVVFRDVSFAGRSLSGPLYYGGRGGYFFTRHLGIDVEYIHLKVFAHTSRAADATGTVQGATVSGRMPISNLVQRFSISHGVNLLLLNAVLREPLTRSDKTSARILLTARAGAGITIPHGESQVLGRTQEQYQIGRAAMQAGGGFEVRLWRSLYGITEYKFTHTGERVEVNSGTIRTPLNSHHLIFGAGWNF